MLSNDVSQVGEKFGGWSGDLREMVAEKPVIFVCSKTGDFSSFPSLEQIFLRGHPPPTARGLVNGS